MNYFFTKKTNKNNKKTPPWSCCCCRWWCEWVCVELLLHPQMTWCKVHRLLHILSTAASCSVTVTATAASTVFPPHSTRNWYNQEPFILFLMVGSKSRSYKSVFLALVKQFQLVFLRLWSVWIPISSSSKRVWSLLLKDNSSPLEPSLFAIVS